MSQKGLTDWHMHMHKWRCAVCTYVHQALTGLVLLYLVLHQGLKGGVAGALSL